MVRLTPTHAGDHLGSIPLAICLFASVSALVALCVKHSRKVPRNNVTETTDSRIPPRSPLRSPKQLITTLSNKAIPFINQKRPGHESEAENGNKAEEEGFGEGGLWQKNILMGEKCQPPEFSGAIYYDGYGRRISELPKSPRRASPLPTFSFPAAKDSN